MVLFTTSYSRRLCNDITISSVLQLQSTSRSKTLRDSDIVKSRPRSQDNRVNEKFATAPQPKDHCTITYLRLAVASVTMWRSGSTDFGSASNSVCDLLGRSANATPRLEGSSHTP